MRRSDLSPWITCTLVVSAFIFGPRCGKAQTSQEGTRTGTISGHVYRADTGAPLSGAVLTLHLTRWQRPAAGPPAPPPAVRSGADGAYTFSSLDTNNYTIQIWPPGGFLSPQPPIRRVIVAVGDPTEEIDFRLQPAAAISGSVHDEYNDPLPGMTAAVFCPPPDADLSANDLRVRWKFSAITDDRGEFRVSGVPSGHCYVGVSADERVLYAARLRRAKFYPDADSLEQAKAFEVKSGEEIRDLHFRFPLALSGAVGALGPTQQLLPLPSPGPTTGAVSGHVYRADTGAPLAGAILHLTPLRELDNIAEGAPVPSPIAARTAADGSYTFAMVEPRVYGVEVEHQDFAHLILDGPPGNAADPGRIGVSAGQHVTGLNYKLQPTGAITGSVHDQDGVPLQRLLVTAFCSRADSLSHDRPEAGHATTDDQGNFRISEIVPGDCNVGAGPVDPLNLVGYRGVFFPNADTMDDAQSVPVKAGGGAPEISWVVRYSPTYSITVKLIKDEDATAQRLYAVSLMPVDPGMRPLANLPGFGAAFPRSTAADGSAVLRGVTAGAYEIRLYPVQEVIGAQGPTIMHPDGSNAHRAPESHAWRSGGPAAGSASVQVVDRDVCVQIQIADSPPSPLLPNPLPGEKCGETPTHSSSVPEDQRQGCALLPYPRTQTDGQTPPDPDYRGGMLCRFALAPQLPIFAFHFTAEGDNPWGKIEVTEGDSANVIQTIHYPHESPYQGAGPPDPLNILKPLDVNFDGVQDLALLLQCGAVGNCTYDFYRYDPATHRFVFDSFLSGLTMPMFDPGNKQVKSYTHMSAGDGGCDTYQYQDGKYTLIRQEVSSWNREKDVITRKTYELRDGKMHLTKCDGECQEK